MTIGQVQKSAGGPSRGPKIEALTKQLVTNTDGAPGPAAFDGGQGFRGRPSNAPLPKPPGDPMSWLSGGDEDNGDADDLFRSGSGGSKGRSGSPAPPPPPAPPANLKLGVGRDEDVGPSSSSPTRQSPRRGQETSADASADPRKAVSGLSAHSDNNSPTGRARQRPTQTFHGGRPQSRSGNASDDNHHRGGAESHQVQPRSGNSPQNRSPTRQPQGQDPRQAGGRPYQRKPADHPQARHGQRPENAEDRRGQPSRAPQRSHPHDPHSQHRGQPPGSNPQQRPNQTGSNPQQRPQHRQMTRVTREDGEIPTQTGPPSGRTGSPSSPSRGLAARERFEKSGAPPRSPTDYPRRYPDQDGQPSKLAQIAPLNARQQDPSHGRPQAQRGAQTMMPRPRGAQPATKEPTSLGNRPHVESAPVVESRAKSGASRSSENERLSTPKTDGEELKILVLYYTTYGHIKKMCDAVVAGINSVDGMKAIVYQVPETLSQETLSRMNAPKKPNDPVLEYGPLQHSLLQEVAGIMFGIPTRFGSLPAQMKAWFDSTSKAWTKGHLVGKAAGCFFSTAVQGGGQETTALTALTQFTHHGMIFVPPGYSFGGRMFDNSEVHGGSPYGAGCIAGGDGSRAPSKFELDYAFHQGAQFARTAMKLAL